MAKKLIQKDKKNRIFVKQFEVRNFILKNLFYNNNFSKILKWKIMANNFLSKKSMLFCTTNRCIITGRKKRLNSLYSFSRISFLKLIKLNNIVGLKKFSW